MAGILPTRFTENSRWEDQGHARMNTWLDTTRSNTARINTLWGLVRQLMRRRMVIEQPQEVGLKIVKAVVVAASSGDTLTARKAVLQDGVVWGTGDIFTVAKFWDVRRTPFDEQTPGDGYTYTYTADGLTRISTSGTGETETQAVTPSYYPGAVISIVKGDTLMEVPEGDDPVVWQELNARRWAKVPE